MVTMLPIRGRRMWLPGEGGGLLPYEVPLWVPGEDFCENDGLSKPGIDLFLPKVDLLLVVVGGSFSAASLPGNGVPGVPACELLPGLLGSLPYPACGRLVGSILDLGRGDDIDLPICRALAGVASGTTTIGCGLRFVLDSLVGGLASADGRRDAGPKPVVADLVS